MPTVFFVSSIGDTDLAKATITQLIEAKTEDPIFLVPVTETAQDRIKDMAQSSLVKSFSLAEIVQHPEILKKKQITSAELIKLADFISKNKINRAFIGVPSPLDEEIPFQIAHSLKIPCTIAYEYMFNAPSSHQFWKYLDSLVAKKDCDFAVPLQSAETDIHHKNKGATLYTVGHLSIDRALIESKVDIRPARAALSIKDEDDFVFISGTTQPTPMDKNFLEALLGELATGNYPRLQLRFGIHPGVRDLDDYLNNLLEVCARYPVTKSQFKIILPAKLKDKLRSPVLSEFILERDVSGPDAGQSADKIAQAVPGALLNEAALKGKPAYFHEKSSIPYLKGSLFAESIQAFFSAKPRPICTREELGLKDTAPAQMLGLMRR